MTSKCLIFLLALSIMGRVAFAEFQRVVPPEAEFTEGDGVGFDTPPPPNGSRVQQLYSASFFSDLPASQNTIVSMAWRPDHTITDYLSTSLELELWLSTTSVEPGAMSTTFASNRGADETLVYSGPITFQTDGSGPAEGPRPFDYVFEFQTPFIYDPGQGNLLREFSFKRGTIEGPFFADRQSGNGMTTTMIALEDSASIAILLGSGYTVTQFTILPRTSGDFDNDGDVDGFDFLAWQRGESPIPSSNDDRALWQANYGAACSLTTVQAVPEPATWSLQGCALIVLLLRRLDISFQR